MKHINTAQQKKITSILDELYNEAKYDQIRIMKAFANVQNRTMQPSDLKEAYLSISKSQGEELVSLITQNNLKNIVEFGTSFGISTLFLSQAAINTEGHIITTELIVEKAEKALENFKKADVDTLIDLRIGNAVNTLKNHNEQVDFLLLDGWKDLYLPVFEILEPNFHKGTIIYVDNADMSDCQTFLKTVSKNKKFKLQSKHHGKVVLIHQN
ncbi:O-methyltransferase [Maribacter sp. 1_MG-2023]|uniref:O-methyltransferase n=1 Tax=Maribacter sp. 1_MG-2023 TaxID=3062677 RepID=UPI0026E2A93C|nr:class I SAM-dependent methyltransferase [Maribacter sp. 1_MG-2023]MDO6473289.1 class I SAM-dependent methyltransferase [Maribacter sp. 1_MG-2023]